MGSALAVYESWRKVGASVEAHAYATGDHGFGAPPPEQGPVRWMDDMFMWMDGAGLLDRS